MKKLILILFVFTSFLLKSETNDNISMGDHYFTLMRYRDAIAWYKLDSTKADAQWKIARAYICYGDYTSSESEQESSYRSAEKASRKCILISETNSNGHTWLAAALGNIAIYEGSKTKVRLCQEIKKELDRAIALNPKDDIAFSILGTFYRVLGNISWLERELAMAFIGKIPPGGYSDSERAFNQSTALSSKIMRHWFELGLLYQDWGKKDEAKKAFLMAKQCPILLASDKLRMTDIDMYLKDL